MIRCSGATRSWDCGKSNSCRLHARWPALLTHGIPPVRRRNVGQQQGWRRDCAPWCGRQGNGSVPRLPDANPGERVPARNTIWQLTCGDAFERQVETEGGISTTTHGL